VHELSQVTGKKKGRWINPASAAGSWCQCATSPCEKGSHIQDLPWFKWAHRGNDADLTDAIRFCRAYKELKFVRSSQHGEGLASLRVVCNGCKRSRPLSELVSKRSLNRDGIKCEGTQPWQDPQPGSICEHHLVAVKRGATGNYIAERLSALDIPEERPQSADQADQIRDHVYFEKVTADNGGPPR
jgi:hypothetical protein